MTRQEVSDKIDTICREVAAEYAQALRARIVARCRAELPADVVVYTPKRASAYPRSSGAKVTDFPACASRIYCLPYVLPLLTFDVPVPRS